MEETDNKKLYIDILLWTYEKGQVGFKKSELFERFSLDSNPDLRNWVTKVFFRGTNDDRGLIDVLLENENGNLTLYALTDKGMSSAVGYLELREARKGSYIAATIGIVALFVAIWTGILARQSIQITQRALELSASPVLTIIFDRSSVPENADEVTIAAGLLPTENSILKLLLVNNSVSRIDQVDMRMTLWKLYVNRENRHLTVCPLGYINHNDNPNFTISNLSSTNLFNKKFALAENKTYPFNIDFNNLEKIQLVPGDSKVLLKIDVNFVKTASQTSHNYVKLYVPNSFGGYVVDTEIAPTLALGLADRKEEVEIDGFKIPSLVHPFQEEEFLSYFENSTPELDLTPGACREFTLSKELKKIFY